MQQRGGSETGSAPGPVPGSAIGSVYEELEAESANYGAALADGFDSDSGGRRGFRDMLRRTAGPLVTDLVLRSNLTSEDKLGGALADVRAGGGWSSRQRQQWALVLPWKAGLRTWMRLAVQTDSDGIKGEAAPHFATLPMQQIAAATD